MISDSESATDTDSDSDTDTGTDTDTDTGTPYEGDVDFSEQGNGVSTSDLWATEVSVDNGPDPLIGCSLPSEESEWESLYGKDAAGTWTLTLSDTYANASGTFFYLNYWKLEINGPTT